MAPSSASGMSPFTATSPLLIKRSPSSPPGGTVVPSLTIAPPPSALSLALYGRSAESYIPTPGSSQGHLVVGQRKKKSHAKRQPAGHIPRPRNAFILFRCDFVAQKKVPASVEHDHRNISRIAGKIWQEMSERQRAPWVKMAEQEKEIHRRKYPGYRYTPTGAAAGVAKERKTATNKRGCAAQTWDPSIVSSNYSPTASSVPSTPDTGLWLPSPPLQSARRSSSCPPPASMMQPNAFDLSLCLPMTQDDIPRRPSRMLHQMYSGVPSSTPFDYGMLGAGGWNLNLFDPTSHYGSYPPPIDAACAQGLSVGRERSAMKPEFRPVNETYSAPLEPAGIFSNPWNARDKKETPQDTLGYDLPAPPPYTGGLVPSMTSVDPLHPALTDFARFESVHSFDGAASSALEQAVMDGSESFRETTRVFGAYTLQPQFGDLDAADIGASGMGDGEPWTSDFSHFKFYDSRV